MLGVSAGLLGVSAGALADSAGVLGTSAGLSSGDVVVGPVEVSAGAGGSYEAVGDAPVGEIVPEVGRGTTTVLSPAVRVISVGVGAGEPPPVAWAISEVASTASEYAYDRILSTSEEAEATTAGLVAVAVICDNSAERLDSSAGSGVLEGRESKSEGEPVGSEPPVGRLVRIPVAPVPS